MKALGNRSLSTLLALIVNIAWWVEWIAVTVFTGVIISAAVFKRNVSLSIPVSFSAIDFKAVSSVDKNIPGGQLQVMNGNFVFPFTMTLQNTLLVVACVLVAFTVLLLITYQLKHIFLNFKRDRPFNKLNIPRIRNVGILLICCSVVQWLFTIVSTLFLQSHFAWEDGISLTYHFEPGFIISGIIVLVVAAIFRLGFALEEENNLTI